MSPVMAVRPEGANHQWRKNPPGELSIDPVADEQLVPMSGMETEPCRMAQATAPILDSTPLAGYGCSRKKTGLNAETGRRPRDKRVVSLLQAWA
jgi:hypothetical protein